VKNVNVRSEPATASFRSLAYQLALPQLVKNRLTPIGRLSAQAVLVRALHANSEKLERFGDSLNGLGFANAVLQAIKELRLAGVDQANLEALAPELSLISVAFADQLETSSSTCPCFSSTSASNTCRKQRCFAKSSIDHRKHCSREPITIGELSNSPLTFWNGRTNQLPPGRTPLSRDYKKTYLETYLPHPEITTTP